MRYFRADNTKNIYSPLTLPWFKVWKLLYYLSGWGDITRDKDCWKITWSMRGGGLSGAKFRHQSKDNEEFFGRSKILASRGVIFWSWFFWAYLVLTRLWGNIPWHRCPAEQSFGSGSNRIFVKYPDPTCSRGFRSADLSEKNTFIFDFLLSKLKLKKDT